jgi:hypothetical protein
VGEGFTLIAARQHVPSMLDLDADAAEDLGHFAAEVRSRLERLYGPTSIAEHGRVAPCISPATRLHEPHCFHAHWLVFPGHAKIDLARVAPGLRISRYPDFAAACSEYDDPGQYLYVEDAQGHSELGRVDGPLPRQFLRAVVAKDQGRPHLADWRAHPGFDEIEAARRTLGLATAL